MFLKGKCKYHKTGKGQKSEKGMIKERHLEKMVFQVLEINTTLTSRMGQDTSGREKNMNKDIQKGKHKTYMQNRKQFRSANTGFPTFPR